MSESLEKAEIPFAESGAPSLRATVVRGAMWTGWANATAILINTITGLALARLLTPEDFGVQAAVLTVTAFFNTVFDVSVGTAVVQRKDLREDELSSIFWSAIVASLIVFLLIAGAAPFFATVFSSQELRLALPAAALNVLVVGIGIVPSALLRQRLAFSTVARAQATGAVFAAITAAIVALSGGKYWALIAYTLMASGVATAWVSIASKWRPSLVLVPAHLASVRSYAGSMMAFQAVNYWSRNLNNVLIGRFLGIGPLGFFNLGQRLIGAPLQLLQGSFAPILHPAFARMDQDVSRQRNAYLGVVRVTSLFTFCLGAALFVLAEPLVLTVAGESWRPTVDVVRAFGLLVAIQPVNMLSGPIFMARDAAHVMFRCATAGAVAVVLGMVIGLRYGLAGVAWGYTIAYVVVAAPLSTITAFVMIDGRVRDLMFALRRATFSAVVVLAVLALAQSSIGPIASPQLSLAVMSLLLLVVFAVAAGGTMRELIAGAREGRRPA